VFFARQSGRADDLLGDIAVNEKGLAQSPPRSEPAVAEEQSKLGRNQRIGCC
jgi:hypothetical protein